MPRLVHSLSHHHGLVFCSRISALHQEREDKHLDVDVGNDYVHVPLLPRSPDCSSAWRLQWHSNLKHSIRWHPSLLERPSQGTGRARRSGGGGTRAAFSWFDFDYSWMITLFISFRWIYKGISNFERNVTNFDKNQKPIGIYNSTALSANYLKT